MSVHEGQEFEDFAAFKRAMLAWANNPDTQFSYRVKKSDSTRNTMVCAHADCPFRISAVRNEDRDCVVVANLMEEHTCTGAGPVIRNPSSRQSWLQQILPTTLPITKDTTPRQIIDAVALHHHVTINYEAAKKAKKSALGDDLIQQAEQFGRLPAYVDALQAADPAAHTRLSIENREGTRRFQRIFICPGTSRETFRHCRPFIAMDGTFTKEIFNLTILLAVTVDADNHAIILAWAVVEGESESSWRYFFTVRWWYFLYRCVGSLELGGYL
jgi:hypothetical protein